MSGNPTKLHDYRVLLESFPDVTVVGGQAISAWAIAYLDPKETAPESYATSDMDVIARTKVDAIVAALPSWKPEKPRMWSMDTRRLRLSKRADDGRMLIIEVLSKVRGLEKEDLEATIDIFDQTGMKYRVLDPVAMLRAKAANVREIDQLGPPPRHDRDHLQVIARCVAPFLSDIHQQAAGNPEQHGAYAKTFSRLFRTLSHRATLRTLLAEGIKPTTLVPPEMKDSPIEKVRTAYYHQLPRLAEMET